jgi:hypothetical protein
MNDFINRRGWEVAQSRQTPKGEVKMGKIREEKMEVAKIVTFHGLFQLEHYIGLARIKEPIIELLPKGAYLKPTDSGELACFTNEPNSFISACLLEIGEVLCEEATNLAERANDYLGKTTGSRGLHVPSNPDFFEDEFFVDISPQTFIKKGVYYRYEPIREGFEGSAWGPGTITLQKEGDKWIATHRWWPWTPEESAVPGKFPCRSDRYGYISCEKCPKYQPKQLGIYCCQMPLAAVHAHDRVVAWDKYGNQNDIEDEDLELFGWIRPVA